MAKKRFVMFMDSYVGICSLYAAEISKETDKTIKTHIDHSKPYPCYRTFINKKSDRYIILENELEVLERFMIYQKAQKEFDEAQEKFNNLIRGLIK